MIVNGGKKKEKQMVKMKNNGDVRRKETMKRNYKSII